ncbi:cell division protein FtsQ/DivIB [Bryobacter aggregatus]|uniref:cell division protein FtsQ/DivIB n=1 Tax=Bryobacter aggregatus TaxID=360054 RepID=UPI000568D6EE|nr:FtsQ-type POTRA domain-containing protein [Bryobacter aggregatus]
MASEKEKKKASKESTIDFSKILSRSVMACGLIVLIGGGVLLEGQVERYLMRDTRFYLERAPEYGDPPPNLQIDGLHYASREMVLKTFEEDLGRSVFLLPLDKRRTELMSKPWIRDATVSRLWPNRVSVQILERKPVAFVKREGGAETTVIDSDGVLMEAPPAASFSLPVVSGVGPEVSDEARRFRIHRVERLIKDLGEHVKEIGEIDAEDSDNMQIVQALHGKAVTLVLGNRNFKLRYENFLAMADQLMEKLPNAQSFDLRLEEQVTAAEKKTPRRKNGQ